MSWIVSATAEDARIFDLQGTEIRFLEAFGPCAEATQSESAAERQTFAQALAGRLRQARLAGKYERLVLVAEPKTLETLRRALDEVTRRLLIASIPRDLNALGARALFACLPARCVS